ncbi:hypothetical protein TIFTF001_049751 [Ficus carica]|uniref:Uncharacterized protein n=1 Tax=Ficus carica TaxID=3494 RepID=A0AA87ZTW5_FICCA|nr:hypothetical protein TIFTF001_049751 [Ficus carica]
MERKIPGKKKVKTLVRGNGGREAESGRVVRGRLGRSSAATESGSH